MTTAAPVNDGLASLLLDHCHWITIEEYRWMSGAGIFDPEARLGDYVGKQRGSGDVTLAIKVSDSSYATDRRVKWHFYAASGILIYWLLDLKRRVLEVHSDPSPDGYRALRTLGADDEISLILDDREVA